MDLGTPLWGVQDDSMEGGGRERLEHVLEIERLRTNIGHIRVKTSGTSFPDKVEQSLPSQIKSAYSGALFYWMLEQACPVLDTGSSMTVLIPRPLAAGIFIILMLN